MPRRSKRDFVLTKPNGNMETKRKRRWRTFIIVLFCIEIIGLFYSNYRLYLIINDTPHWLKSSVEGSGTLRHLYLLPGQVAFFPVTSDVDPPYSNHVIVDENPPGTPGPCSDISAGYVLSNAPHDPQITGFGSPKKYDHTLAKEISPVVDLLAVRLVLVSKLKQADIVCGG